MKAIKLTPKQREVFELLKSLPGGVIRKHIKGTNTVCYRVLDKDKNPKANIGMSFVDKLIEKDVLQISGFDYVLKATSEVA